MICWESYIPLARVALYQKGITIYISPNTNDNPEWQATIQHIAIEGKCFFVNADMVIRRESYPSDLHEGDVASRFPEYVCRGGSCIVDPRGHYVTEPVWDEEAIIYAVRGCGHFFGPATPPVPGSSGTASGSSSPVSPSAVPRCSISDTSRACGRIRGWRRPTNHDGGRTRS